MSTPMTDEEIEKLCAEATPGPWKAVRAVGGYGAIVEPSDSGLDSISCDYIAQQDADFISAARTLVPELLERARRAEDAREVNEARVERQAERIRFLEQEVAALTEGSKRLAQERDAARPVYRTARYKEVVELQAEVAALKGERDRLRGALERVMLEVDRCVRRGTVPGCTGNCESSAGAGCAYRDARAALEGKP